MGVIDEATLSTDGERQKAPPERERRQGNEGRPNRSDLEVEEVYYETGDSQDDVFGKLKYVQQFKNSENINEMYHMPRPGDVVAGDRDVFPWD